MTATEPSITLALLRIVGALALVTSLFLGGAWLFRNWQRLAAARTGQPRRLQVLEARSLGQRHSLFVVGYDDQRFLLASSPTGVAFLSHLAAPDTPDTTPAAAAPSGFDRLLTQASGRAGVTGPQRA